MGYNTFEFKYCPACSKELAYDEIEGKLRKNCTDCGFIHWGEFSVGVGGVLLDQGRGLIVQRAHNPGKGRWTIPGGYVEEDEKIDDAIIREVREETGLITKPISVLGVKDRPQDGPGIKHDIYVVFLLRYLSGALEPDPAEVSQAGFYTPQECQEFNIAPLSLHVIKKGIEYEQKGILTPGLVRKEGIQIVGSLSEFYSIL